MNNEQPYDLAILGGGCAGLGLARELAAHRLGQRVIIIEPRHRYEDDRSWCFWAPTQHRLKHMVSHTWSRWAASRLGQASSVGELTGHGYHYVRASDYYEACLGAVRANAQIELALGQAATDVKRTDQGWLIQANETSYVAREVIDTRPLPKAQGMRALLLQCFMGVEIELNQDSALDLDEVELMTNMRLLDGEFCFDYVLPLAANRVLAEVTFFSRQPVDCAQLTRALEQMLTARQWHTARVLRREHGVLPMGLIGLPPASADQPTRAGMGGNALRSSSGYGFLRIQSWARACAAHFVKTGQVINQHTSTPTIERMDRLFLKVVGQNPALAPELFDAMFKRVPTQRLLRFMGDDASWRDCLSIIASQPTLPFLKSLMTARLDR